MALNLTALRARTRQGGRNALDPLAYSNAAIDTAIMDAGNEWCRITRAIQKSASLTLAAGAFVLPTFPADFLPEFLIDSALTLNGKLIEPGIEFTTWQQVLESQSQFSNPTAPGTPRIARPRFVGFWDQSHAALDTACDFTYTLTLRYWCLFPMWTPGNGDNTAPATFPLPDDHLALIASMGAPYYLQRFEPANAARAQKVYEQFMGQARAVAGRAAGSPVAQTLYRVLRPLFGYCGRG